MRFMQTPEFAVAARVPRPVSGESRVEYMIGHTVWVKTPHGQIGWLVESGQGRGHNSGMLILRSLQTGISHVEKHSEVLRLLASGEATISAAEIAY